MLLPIKKDIKIKRKCVKKTLRKGYVDQFHVIIYISFNLDKIDKFLAICYLPKLTQKVRKKPKNIYDQ